MSSADDKAVVTLCEICEEGPQSQKCLDCDQPMCAPCQKKHLRMRASADHTFIGLIEARLQATIAQMGDIRRRVRDEIEATAKKEEAVKENMAATQRALKTFANAVQLRCRAVSQEINNKGKILLTDIESKQDRLMDSDKQIGARIDKINKMQDFSEPLLSIEDATRQYLKESHKFADELLGDDAPVDKLELVFPFEEKVIESIGVHIHSDSSRGDSGAFMYPPCCEHLKGIIEPPIDEPQTAPPADAGEEQEEELPPIPAKQSSTKRKPPKAEPVQEGYVEMQPEDFSEIAKIYKNISFNNLYDKVFKQGVQIQQDVSNTINFINNELWVVSSHEINVYDNYGDFVRCMTIQSLSAGGKKATGIQTCAQNIRGNVFVALTRSEVLARKDALNGLWMIHPLEGHAVAKLASFSAGYSNVACDGEKVIGLTGDGGTITVHAPTGTELKAWVQMRTISISGLVQSLAAFNSSIYISNGSAVNILDLEGAVVTTIDMPSKEQGDEQEPSLWNLCAIDREGQLLLSDETHGHVVVLKKDQQFTRLHFGEKGSDLEDPTQVLPDCKGNLWVHEHTIYGTIISQFQP